MLKRIITGCTAAVAASDARIAAAAAAASDNPPCVVRKDEEPKLALEIPHAHRAILEAAEAGTSIAEVPGIRGMGDDPWYVQELADVLCERYGYTYRKADIGKRPADW